LSSEPTALEGFLRTIPLFSLMEAPDMMELLRLLQPVELEAGQVVFRQGEPGTAMWVLGSPVEVSLTAVPRQGKRPGVIAYARAGNTLGEMALIDDGARSATAVVVQGGPAHRIDAQDFHALRQNHSPPAFKILRQLCLELCTKLRAASDKVVAPSGRTLAAAPPPAGRRATDADVDEFSPLAQSKKTVKLALAQKLTVIDLEGVQPIFGEGEEADAAYFITRGEVTVGRNGKTLATLRPGSMLGIIAVLDRGRRSASCLSGGQVRLLRLARGDFETLFTSGNQFAFDLVELVSRQLVSHVRDTNELIPRPGQIQARLTPPQPIPAIRLSQPKTEAEILPLELDVDVSPASTLLG
jgi:CRP-like cAMP-binding protein